MDTAELFGTEKISKILFRLAPPVMLAQLIQALYNIIDSLFVEGGIPIRDLPRCPSYIPCSFS